MSKVELAVVEQRDVVFYEDTLTAVKVKSGKVFVSVRAICEALTIDHRAQYRRIRRNRTLEKGFMVVKMTTIKGLRDTNVLRVDLLPLFLTGIGTKSIKDEAIREKLEIFQDNAAQVLWDAFQVGELSADKTFTDLLAQGGEVVEAYQMLQGMLKLAKNQVLLQGRVQDHESRIETIEAELGNPERFLTQTQAMEVSQAVKMLGFTLGKQSGRNEFQGVWGEVYRRFKVTSYHKLPSNQFEEVMNFLRQWWQSLTDDDAVPF